MKSAATKSKESGHSSNTLSNKKGQDSFFGKKENDQVFFQPKIKIGSPKDRYEREADKVADKVVSEKDNNQQSPAIPVQRQRDEEKQVQQKSVAETITPIGKGQSEGEILQGKPAFESSTEYDQNTEKQATIQRSESDNGGSNNSVSDTGLSSRLDSSRNSGAQLPSQTRYEMEEGIGADFSNTRVHTDQDAVQMNRDLNSKAFTSGSDIYFNEGKYNPGTKEGDHLLAHELTHTIQQGSSPVAQNNTIQTKADTGIQKQSNSKSKSAESELILTPVDISSAFKPNESVAAYLDKHHYKWKDVPVFMGKHAKDNIKVRQTKRAKEGIEPKYTIKSRQGLSYTGVDFLNPLRERKLEPVIALNAKDSNNISGFISIRQGKTVYSDPKSFITQINKNIEHLGLLGISPLKVPGYENKVVNGVVTLKTSELSTSVAGFLDASGSFGLVGERFNFELNTQVNLSGLQGDFKIKRDEKGKFSGEGEIGVTIANLTGKVKATYAAGDVSVLGSVGIESEKFSGKISIMVADKVKAKQTMMAELGVKTMEDEKKQPPSPKAATKKTKENQVVIGWGSVTARITPWLEGTASIGVDDQGQVTIVGTIQVPNEIPLMKQKTKRVDLFKLEIKAGYGVPLVGQIGLFASVGLFVTAGFGPLVLRNVKFEGTYSTDPSVLQNFLITGTLGISAFAAIGLEAKAGVFVTLLGHDIKAGIKVTAMAGLKAYAEATPTFEYLEKKSPEGGKVGEAWLKGHFEAAAQLFLKLAGAFFVELDSPWWSPAPDKTWEYPLGDVEYPLGPSLGIGGDVKWLVGSSDVPELKFTPVDFDPSKFTSDMMADPPKSKGGGKGGKQKGKGKWDDKSSKGGKKGKPDVKKDNKGLNGKKKEDTSKWPDEKKYMRALGNIGSLGDASKKQPITYKALDAKLKQIKQQYRINQITPKNKKDGSVKVYVKHAKQNNGRKLIEIKLMSESERKRLVDAAKKDLQTKMKAKADPKSQTIKNTDAKVIATEIAKKHKVFQAIKVLDGVNNWDYELDLGDKKDIIKGKEKPFDENKVKQEQFKKGLAAVDVEEKKYLTRGTISKKEALKIASTIKQKYPVFKTFTIVDGKTKWNYKYIVNPTGEIVGEDKEEAPPRVGLHGKLKGINRESHHVPPNKFKVVISGFFKKIAEKIGIIAKDPVYKEQGMDKFGKIFSKRSADIDKEYPEGKNLSAILIHKDTHRTGKFGVHRGATMPKALEEIEKETDDGEKRIVVFTGSGKRMAAQLYDSHWQNFLRQVYKLETKRKDETTEERDVIKGGDKEANIKTSKNIEEEIKDTFEKVNDKSKTKQKTEINKKKNEIRGDINKTLVRAFKNALANAIAVVRAALKKSKMDGTKAEQSKAMDDMKTKADGVWKEKIIKSFDENQ